MPEESKNAAFYQKHGFSIMEDGVAMQICHRWETHKLWFVKEMADPFSIVNDKMNG